MKDSTHHDSTGSLYLTGTILLANLDASALIDYSVKAMIGGAIWMAFKLGSEYISDKIKNRKP